ncbi:undecaprenyl-diphosphatase UppP [Candidatus Electronema sp. TJ]|uniref:undecaprenyl-diphosphatase UppP n=1 Tax=Candidatus Electronema sp. TJ TaxID=3401573 RepID=UPI003AA843AC
MTLLQAFVLGLVQGLTEFIPVSSSGHLVLAPRLLGWHFPKEQAFIFDVLVQMGTLVAVLVYYRHDLAAITSSFFRGIARRQPFAEADARMGWLLILATLPAVVIGLLCKDLVEQAFASPKITGVFLLCTAVLLVIAELAGRRRRSMQDIDWKDSLWIGFSQALALLPGLSRSGATLAGGMTRHLDRPAAARFSFLMSVPVMVGAGVLAGKDLLGLHNVSAFLPPLLVGFLTAMISGYIAIRWLISYLSRHSLHLFAGYCAALGLTVLLLIR